MEVVLHFQDTGAVPGDGRPVRMTGDCLTVGRGAENDLQLPDPDRTLSKRHCVIETRGGDVVVVDLSTNGTFLNYARAPLGASPTRLGDGDVLTVGPYELRVGIGPGGAAAAPAGGWDDLLPPAADPSAPPPRGTGGIDDPLADTGGGGGDFLDDLLGETPAGPGAVRRTELGSDGELPPIGADDAPGPGGWDASDDHMGASAPQHGAAELDHFAPPRASHPAPGAIPDDWDDLLAPVAAPRAAGPAPVETPPPPPVPISPEDDPFAEPDEETVPPPASASGPSRAGTVPSRPVPPALAPAAPGAGTGGSDAAARAFLDALGASDLGIPPEDLPEVMARLGRVTRALLTGAREVLMTRSSIKSEFRIEQTRIGAGGNNPLKFSVSPDQAVRAMVRPDAAGYLDPVEAAEEAMRDIRIHEMAVAAGMEAALKGILSQLAPDALEGKLEGGGGLGGLLKGRKARYWELYESMYAEIAGEAASDFHDRFAREFARAYAAQLERLR